MCWVVRWVAERVVHWVLQSAAKWVAAMVAYLVGCWAICLDAYSVALLVAHLAEHLDLE